MSTLPKTSRKAQRLWGYLDRKTGELQGDTKSLLERVRDSVADIYETAEQEGLEWWREQEQRVEAKTHPLLWIGVGACLGGILGVVGLLLIQRAIG